MQTEEVDYEYVLEKLQQNENILEESRIAADKLTEGLEMKMREYKEVTKELKAKEDEEQQLGIALLKDKKILVMREEQNRATQNILEPINKKCEEVQAQIMADRNEFAKQCQELSADFESLEKDVFNREKMTEKATHLRKLIDYWTEELKKSEEKLEETKDNFKLTQFDKEPGIKLLTDILKKESTAMGKNPNSIQQELTRIAFLEKKIKEMTIRLN